MRKQFHSVVGLFALVALTAGCITDYGGRTGEMTQGEAKLFGKEFAQSGFGEAAYDGTWAKAVQYNLKQGAPKVVAMNYHNPVFGAFSRELVVDREGDDIQGNAGSLSLYPASPAGQFNNGINYVDNTPGAPCEFAANERNDYTGGTTGAGVMICFFGFVEEVDSDLALQDAFGSIDDLLKGIWGGTVGNQFSLDMTSVTLNGNQINLQSPINLSLQHNGLRPGALAVDGSQPGVQELIDAVLANTNHMEPTDIGIAFGGGMSVSAPVYMTVAFDHDVLGG